MAREGYRYCYAQYPGYDRLKLRVHPDDWHAARSGDIGKQKMLIKKYRAVCEERGFCPDFLEWDKLSFEMTGEPAPLPNTGNKRKTPDLQEADCHCPDSCVVCDIGYHERCRNDCNQ